MHLGGALSKKEDSFTSRLELMWQNSKANSGNVIRQVKVILRTKALGMPA